MRFVVPIPFSLYLIFLLVSVTMGVYVFSIVATIGFVYLLFKAPNETIGLILLLLTFKYWQIGLPLLAVAIIINYLLGDKIKQK